MRSGLKSCVYGHLVTVWVALSVGSIALALMVWLRLGDSLETSLHTARVELGLVDVLASMRAVENDERGYLLTGDPAQRAALAETEAMLPAKFAWLLDATAGTPTRQAAVRQLQATVNRQLQAVHRLLDARRRGATGIPAAAANQEQRDLDELQDIVTGAVPGPRTFLAFEATGARRQMQRSLVITLVAGILSLGTGVFAFYLARVASEKEQNERLLAQQALRAERVAQEKSLFMANMSHEIRTPMNAILGFSEMLATTLPADSREHRQAQAIQESAASLLQLINNILDLSKAEVGRLEIHRELTELRELTDFMRMVFAQQIARKGLRFDLTVAADLPTAVLVDRTRLRQVLVNLLANALKFTNQGSIALRTLWQFTPGKSDLGRLVLEVEDTGPGIPPDQHEAIFQPFVQLETAGIASDQGSGLGLSIVRRLAERMEGTVAVESERGRGSLFRVTFPAVSYARRSADRSVPGDSDAIDFNRLRPATILVVDDNALNRELLAGMFDPTRHSIQFATNGREAIARLREARPDLVLMDIRMPEMDGRIAMAEIRKLPHGHALPIIAVTASSGPEAEPGAADGFSGYVRKPFTRRAIYDEIARFLPLDQAWSLPAPETEARPAAALADPGSAALGRALAALQAGRLAEVRATGAIAEVKDFAQQLSELARVHDNSMLRHYADELRNAADDYASIRIDKCLDQFPSLLAALGQPNPALPSAAHA
jgi:signal transduction histidine kinase